MATIASNAKYCLEQLRHYEVMILGMDDSVLNPPTSPNESVADLQYRMRQNMRMAIFLHNAYKECMAAIRNEALTAGRILQDEYNAAMAAKLEAERVANEKLAAELEEKGGEV